MFGLVKDSLFINAMLLLIMIVGCFPKFTRPSIYILNIHIEERKNKSNNIGKNQGKKYFKK